VGDNPLGKPEWINKRRLIRAVQAALGAVAGLFLAVAGFLWGYWFDEYPLWVRLGTFTGACLAGIGLAIWLIMMIYK
jgi:hypothetical protein